jgi:type II secretory pathway pseudopilin PulG
MNYKSEAGFTLIEALISVLLVGLLVLGIAGLITSFGKFTREDLVGMCLMQAASSGIEAKRANPTLTSVDVRCGGYTIRVNITGTPPTNPPAMGSGQSACADVVATATIENRTMVLRDQVCNFPDG